MSLYGVNRPEWVLNQQYFRLFHLYTIRPSDVLCIKLITNGSLNVLLSVRCRADNTSAGDIARMKKNDISLLVQYDCRRIMLHDGYWFGRDIEMMTSSNGNVFHITGLCEGNALATHRWIPLTKASDAELWYFIWSAPEQTAEHGTKITRVLFLMDIKTGHGAHFMNDIYSIVIQIRWKNGFTIVSFYDTIFSQIFAHATAAWHDSTAVVSCAKFHSDHFTTIWMRTYWDLQRIWTTIEKSFVKRAPVALEFARSLSRYIIQISTERPSSSRVPKVTDLFMNLFQNTGMGITAKPLIQCAANPKT